VDLSRLAVIISYPYLCLKLVVKHKILGLSLHPEKFFRLEYHAGDGGLSILADFSGRIYQASIDISHYSSHNIFAAMCFHRETKA
jgi:hypothetical protein